MNEIFLSNFGILLSNFHWFDPVTAFLFLYHFLINFDEFQGNIISIWFKFILIGFHLNFKLILIDFGLKHDLSEFSSELG